MAVSANATASNVSSVPIPLFANRFQPLEGLQSDEEAIRLHVRFQAEGVYKPPHMRTPSEPVASTAGSDPMVGGTAVVRQTHGTSFGREGRGTSRPHTPHTGLAPEPVAFGFDEMKKMIQEEIMNVRKAEEKMEMIVKELLKEEAHIEQYTQVLRSAGFTDEERRTIVNGNHPGFMPGQPTAQSPNPKSSTAVTQRVDLGSEREVGRLTGSLPQGIEEELVNRTPIPGGPIYSTASYSRGTHQTGKYGYPGPSTTLASSPHQDIAMRQGTGWNEQVQTFPGIAGWHGSISSGNFQTTGQIYEAIPWKFNPPVDSVPPRFRQPPVYYQSAPLHYQNAVQSRPKDIIPAGHPVPWPSAPSRSRGTIPNRTFRPPSVPPPPRPSSYQVDAFFDFEGIASSSNCNTATFVKAYWEVCGRSPSREAWKTWTLVTSEMEESRKATEKEARERRGAGSRLPKWASRSMEELPGPESGCPSSVSDASTKVASSRTSEVGDERNMVVNMVGSNGNRGIEVSHVQKPWKDLADKTWAFGQPPRLDDPEQYMTLVVEKVGWQAHDPRPE